MRKTAVALVLLAVVACAHAPGAVSDRLFCGLTIPGGGEVSEADLQQFVAEVVTPRFPDGFTLYRADGHWGEGGRTIREPAIVIEILRTPEGERAVGEIAAEYVRRFRQTAVLRVTTPVTMSFAD